MKNNPTKIGVNKFKKGIKIEHLHTDMFFISGGSYRSGTSRFATSTAWKTCPCCTLETEVTIHSFHGGGKRCPNCGVVMVTSGAFMELSKMTKFDLINLILKGYEIDIKNSEEPKTKYIRIETTDPIGFAEMSGMKMEIDKLIKEYSAEYNIEYHFKK